MSLETIWEGICAAGAFAYEVTEQFFGAVAAGESAIAEGFDAGEAAEAGEEDSWRTRIRDRAREIGERTRGSMLYKKLSFYGTMSTAIRDGKSLLHSLHNMEKSALSKAEHSWKSVSDKVRHGHWFSSGHGHAMNGVTQGNYDFIVRRKRKHY